MPKLPEILSEVALCIITWAICLMVVGFIFSMIGGFLWDFGWETYVWPRWYKTLCMIIWNFLAISFMAAYFKGKSDAQSEKK